MQGSFWNRIGLGSWAVATSLGAHTKHRVTADRSIPSYLERSAEIGRTSGRIARLRPCWQLTRSSPAVRAFSPLPDFLFFRLSRSALRSRKRLSETGALDEAQIELWETKAKIWEQTNKTPHARRLSIYGGGGGNRTRVREWSADGSTCISDLFLSYRMLSQSAGRHATSHSILRRAS